MIRKNSQQSRYRGNVPQHNKGHKTKPTANIVNSEKLKAFSLRSGTRQRSLLLPLLFAIALEVLLTANRQDKEIKGIQIKKRSKTVEDRILYTENPKDSCQK